MKKILLALCMALPMLVAAQTVKIGVVDLQSVITQMPEYRAGQTQLGEFSKAYEESFGKLRTEFSTKLEEFQKLGENEPASIKERKAKELEEMGQRLETFQQEAEQAIGRKQQELLQPVQQKLLEAVESVGKEQGFTVIQQKSDFLFYSAPAVDITPMVLKKLGL